jgi:pyruvate/2-oxoglutarate dehydrogenase complex dihydrolipoamide dehydrogenase (E3) component/uncharacterized membrane protein YdjX (TVP38/TMEM64 family)
MKKVLAISILLTMAAGFYVLGLDQYLTLDFIKSISSQAQQFSSDSPLISVLAFFIIYVSVTALSLPGAAILTLAGGAFFGFVWGVVIVSFASTIGATFAFLASRFIFKDAVQKRFSKNLSSINAGIEKEGAFYLFTLRLIPVFPFFIVNLLMGLSPIRTSTFYWVSQLGMLAGTLVYVYTGTQLAQIDSLAGIIEPQLLFAFALLGLFPIITAKVINYIKARRIYKQWKKPASFDRNLIVIGGGAAGLVSTIIGTTVKAKVTLIEANKMGGDCLNYGCIPSKALIKSATVAEQLRHADQYGLDASEPSFDFRSVMRRVKSVIAAIEPHDSVERYTGLGAEVLEGYGTIINPWTVDIALNNGETKRLTSRSIIIAAGAQPTIPSIKGIETSGYLTSDTLWSALENNAKPPARLLILGGGPIGCELAQSFSRLGSQVTQLERGERVMPREDADVSTEVLSLLRESRVEVLLNHQAIRFEQDSEQEGNQKYCVVEHAGKTSRIAYDTLICAIGRTPRLTGYGLENIGVDITANKSTSLTNEYLQTVFPNIYAAGDVAGPYQFTHVASHQAWYASVNALFGTFKKFKADYSVIPWTTFTDPEVARVGLNEQEAVQQNIAYEVTRYNFKDLGRALTDNATQGFVKILTVPNKDTILGVCIVGAHGGDLLAEFVLAMRHGLGLNKIIATIHAYPTMIEANKFAAGEWKKAHSPTGLLPWLEKYHTWMRAGDKK